MKSFKAFLLVVLMLGVSKISVGNEQDHSELSKQEISQLFKGYMSKYNRFIKTDKLKTSPSLYDEQVMLITTQGTSNALSAEAMDKGVAAFLTNLKNKGVVKVNWETVEIQLLADNIALASNVAVRYLDNGDIYNKVGATYFLNKSSTGWKISAFAVHAPENSIKLLNKF
jgi:hypothetical protein